MRRRDLMQLMLASAIAFPRALLAQPARKPRLIGVLWHAGDPEEERPWIDELRRRLTELGHVEGVTFKLEHRFANENYDRFAAQATELVRLGVDLIIAVTQPAALAAQRATTTIPIVFLFVVDPVGVKLVASLGRPGGNITGVSMAADLSAKRLQLFKEAHGRLSRVALFVNAGLQAMAQRSIDDTRAAAGPLNVSVLPVLIRKPEDIDNAFAEFAGQKVDGIIVTSDGLLYRERDRLTRLAAQQRIPTMAFTRTLADDGMLMSYGPDYLALVTLVAEYVDAIFQGRKTAELPVQLPTKYELIVNARVAKAMGFAFSPNFLALADQVLQ